MPSLDRRIGVARRPELVDQRLREQWPASRFAAVPFIGDVVAVMAEVFQVEREAAVVAQGQRALPPRAGTTHRRRPQAPSICIRRRNAGSRDIGSSPGRKCRANAETAPGRRATARCRCRCPMPRWQNRQSRRPTPRPLRQTATDKTPRRDGRSDVRHSRSCRQRAAPAARQARRRCPSLVCGCAAGSQSAADSAGAWRRKRACGKNWPGRCG